MPLPPITSKDISPNSDYERLTGDFFRTRAATVLQRAFRQRRLQRAKTVQEKEAYYTKGEKLDTTLKTYYEHAHDSVPAIREPVTADTPFLEHLKAKVLAGQYHEIDYHHQDFTRYLYQALRLDYLTSDQLLTIKLMHDALIAFNQGKMPDEAASTRFKRYPFTQPATGPYSQDEIPYFYAQAQKKLKDSLDGESGHAPHYYTIDFNPEQTAVFFDSLINYPKKHQKRLFPLLENYIKQHALDAEDERSALKALADYQVGKKNPAKSILTNFIKRVQPACFIYHFLGSPHTKKEWGSISFLTALLYVDSSLPNIVTSPDFVASDKSSPLLSFVIPTTDMFHLLQQAVHGKETTRAVPVLGRETPRMIRAMDDIPAAKHQSPAVGSTKGEHDSETQVLEGLKILYPYSADLERPSRPVELTHPDISATSKPHDYDCYDFFLTWHDMFHAWRNGANYKAMIRHLRQLHDNKGGLATNHSGMSKAIWTLTDMDYSAGKIIREQTLVQVKHFLTYINTIHILQTAGLDYDRTTDDSDLILYDMVKHPKPWHDFLGKTSFTELLSSFRYMRMHVFPPSHIDHCDEFFRTLEALFMCTDMATLLKLQQQLETFYPIISHTSYLEATKFFVRYNQMRVKVAEHPADSVIDIIIRSQLAMEKPLADALIQLLNESGYDRFFYYSANTGIYLNKSLRAPLKHAFKDLPFDIDPCLRNNSADVLCLLLLFLLRDKLTPALKSLYLVTYLKHTFSYDVLSVSDLQKLSIDDANLLEIGDDGRVTYKQQDVITFIYHHTHDEKAKSRILKSKLERLFLYTLFSTNLPEFKDDICSLLTLSKNGRLQFKDTQGDFDEENSPLFIAMLYKKTHSKLLKISILSYRLGGILGKTLYCDELTLPDNPFDEEGSLTPDKALLTLLCAQPNTYYTLNHGYFGDVEIAFARKKSNKFKKQRIQLKILDLKTDIHLKKDIVSYLAFYQHLYDVVEENAQQQYTRRSGCLCMARHHQSKPLSDLQMRHLRVIKQTFLKDVRALHLSQADNALLQSKLDDPQFFINHNLTRFSFFKNQPGNRVISKHTRPHSKPQSILRI